MLTAYRFTGEGLTAVDGALEDHPVWIDLNAPTPEEAARVEALLGVDVPTADEMREIEISSRLYAARGALVMTMLSLVKSDTPHPETTDITFILTPACLVTVRHADPRPIAIYAQRAAQGGEACRSPENVMMGLVDTIIDRIADVLEHCGAQIDTTARVVFEHGGVRPISPREFRSVVAAIGRAGELAAKARESLVTVSRLLMFLSASALPRRSAARELNAHVKSALRDANQLADHAAYLSNRTGFLMDATTGLISIEQNGIIKIFSVAAVALMPPTLIASIYGMNFQHMPELEVWWAYPAVLVAMLVSAIAPYVLFRRKGWL